MGLLRFLFAPELTRPFSDAVRASAEPGRWMTARRDGPSGGASADAAAGKPGGRRRWGKVGKFASKWATIGPTGNGPTGSGLLIGRTANRPGLSLRPAFAAALLLLFACWIWGGLGSRGLLAGPAAAQTIDRGLFADADRATRDVLAFLGEIGAGRDSVLGDMLFVFNTGVLALAGFLLVWHTVAGTVDTAREGRFGFGAWEIVRIVAAIALMAPLPGGMNGAQHAVIGLAHLGGDFANAVWKPFSAEALGKGAPIVPRPHEKAWRAAISRTLILETCRHAANASAARAGDAPYIKLRESDVVYKSPGTSRVRRIVATVVHYDGAGRGMPGDLCGAIRFSLAGARGAHRIAAEGHRRALLGVLPEIRALAVDLGARYVTGSPVYGRPLPDLDALLAGRGLAERYAGVLDSALGRATSEERAELARVVAEDAKTASWMSAASFFNTIAHRTGQFQAAAHNIPGVGLPLPSLVRWAPAADAAVKGLMAALVQSRGYQPMLFSAAAGGAAALPAPGSGGGMSARLMEFIDLGSVIVADSGNPIADLAGLGHGLMNAALAAMTVLMGAAAGSGLLESVPFVGKGLDLFESVWQVADGFVSTVLGLLLIAGAVLAYLLPALPFIRFLFAMLGWIVSVAVAVLAVTVFAAAHVTRGDGDRLATPATRLGWLFLPGLILRPPLMLFGLIAGYFVFLAGIGLFNEVWLPQMRDAGASGGLGPIGFLAMLALYVTIAYGLMNASFKLIDLLPSAVLDWIGGRGGAGDDGAGERVGGVAAGAISRIGGLRIGAGPRRGGGIAGSR